MSRLPGAIVLLAAAGANAQDWTALGPFPITSNGYTGRVSALACSPIDPDLYFAGGADSGVWRTTDGGESWTPLTDDLPTTSIGALALDPANGMVVYAGSGEANFANHSRYGLGLYKSEDGGETWRVLAADTFAGRCFSRIVIDPSNTSVLYASIARAGGFPEMAAAKGHPHAAGPLGVFKSLDAGQTWAHLAGGLPTTLGATDLAIDLASPHILYAGIGHIFGDPANGIYKTTDGGGTWTKLAGGLPTTTKGRHSLAVSPDNPARIYAMITNSASATGGSATLDSIYRSDNAGATWVDLGNPIDQATYGWFLSVLSVQPGNPDVVVAGGLTAGRSTNAGAQWSGITPPHVDVHAFAWDAAGRLLVGCDGGVYRSSDLGSTWVNRNSGLGTAQFYPGVSLDPSSDERLFGGLQDNGTVRRNADGTWTHVLGGDGGWTQVDHVNPLTTYAEFQGTGNLYRSTNGGNSYSAYSAGISSSDRNCFLPPFLVDPADHDRLLYATHRVYERIVGRGNWKAISPDLTNGAGAIRAIAIAPSDSSVVYAATNDGNVQVSTDGGTTFTLIVSDNPGWPRVTREMTIHPHDPGTMYLAVSAFGSDRVLRTRDMGQTFETIGRGLPDTPVNVIAVDPRGILTTLYAGVDGGVHRSVDDGVTWREYGRGLPNTSVFDLRLDTSRARLIAGTMGRGTWLIPVEIPGDLNCDGRVDRFDIDAFRLALADPDAWRERFPGCDLLAAGDLDGDGLLGEPDVAVFLDLLAAGAGG